MNRAEHDQYLRDAMNYRNAMGGKPYGDNTCEDCAGEGYIEYDEEQPWYRCPNCEGRGFLH